MKSLEERRLSASQAARSLAVWMGMTDINYLLEDPMIPSDNNGRERGIRKLKIKLKNSCTFRSDFGADAFLELHSIVETAKKHNQTPFNAIQTLFGA